MKIYNYFIEVSDNGIARLIRFSVLASRVQRANCDVSVAIVNSNLHTRNDGYSLHHARLASVKDFFPRMAPIKRYKPMSKSRFIAQYDFDYSFALLPNGGDLFERRRLRRFITQRQHKAFLARFHSVWRKYPLYAKNRGFKP
jgi:hypothetical protein